MSKPPLSEDPDLPPEPSSPDEDLPPEPPPPPEASGSAPKGVPLGAEDDEAAPPPAPLAEELLGSAEKAAPQPSARAEGDVLSVGGAQYRLLKRLGAGGMGEVFLARKQGTGGFERDVALKTVLPTLTNHRTRAQQFLKGFMDEARLAAHLHHPNICQVYDLQPLEQRGLLQVLEYIPGHSLKEIIETARKKKTSLTEPFACFVAAELASALDYAHTAPDSSGKPLGIVHRDVTPHNIMVSDSGTVKLLDFGIAFSALENRDATTSNMVKGKDQYYAPEQLVGSPLDGRTDQFALALCLYEMLVLKRFFSRSVTDTDTQLHLRIAQLTPESVEGILTPANIDTSLKSIIHHALAPSREERFPTCAEFGDALRVFSQRRGWLFTAVDAKREVEALFALPDAPDADKTNPSGKKRYSTSPRKVPNATINLPSLTPGRTALTPPPVPKDSTAPSAKPKPSVDRSRPPAETPAVSPSSPADVSGSASRALEVEAPAAPSESAQRRRLQLQEELHNPKVSAKKMLALPLALLIATLVVGIVLVKFLVLSSPPPAVMAVEVVKTPEQLRAERELQERAAAPATTPPELALPPPAAQQPPALAALPTAALAPSSAPPVAAAPSRHTPAPHPSKGADAKAVDAVLAQQYGGRPVVTPDAPSGSVEAPPAPGPRRRSLDTVMIGDMPAVGGAPGATPHLPRGTTLPARLAAPADATQAAPVTAVITADVVVAGAVAVPKGATVVCTTAPAAGRLGLACDTLTLAGHHQFTIDAVAMGADKRLGLPLPRSASDSQTGAIAKEGALSTARAVLGRVTPDGVAGDLVNGAADTASNGARAAGQPPVVAAPSATVLPAGTPFSLFIQSTN